MHNQLALHKVLSRLLRVWSDDAEQVDLYCLCQWNFSEKFWLPYCCAKLKKWSILVIDPLCASCVG